MQSIEAGVYIGIVRQCALVVAQHGGILATYALQGILDRQRLARQVAHQVPAGVQLKRLILSQLLTHHPQRSCGRLLIFVLGRLIPDP